MFHLEILIFFKITTPHFFPLPRPSKCVILAYQYDGFGSEYRKKYH